MTISTETVRTFCDVLARQVLNDVLTNFKTGSNDQISSEKVGTMNGTILSNHVNHLDNFKKLSENDMTTSENVKNSDKTKASDVESSSNENGKLVEIQEEVQGMLNNDDSSDEAVSSLTSDTDGNSDGTLTDSTEEEVEFFPAKKLDKQTAIDSEGLDKTNETHSSELVTQTNLNSPNTSSQTKLSSSEAITSSSTNNSQNIKNINIDNHDAYNEVSKEHTEQNNPNTESLNKLPRRLNPIHITPEKNEHIQNEHGQVGDSFSNTGLQLIPTTSSDYSEPLASGSSDIVIPTARKHEPPDLIKGNLNGTGSDDSELNDHARILAELQKIVQDDEMNDSGKSKNDAATAGEGGQRSNESAVEAFTQSNKELVRNDGSPDQGNVSNGDHGILIGGHSTHGANAQNDGSKNTYHGNNQLDQPNINSTLKSNPENNDTQLNASAVNGAKNQSNHYSEHENVDDGTANNHLDKSISELHAGTHENVTSHHEAKLDDKNGTGSMLHGKASGQFDGIGNDYTKQGPPANTVNKEQGGTKTDGSKSKTQHTTPTSSNTNLQATNQPANFTTQEHSLDNLERKLSNLQISNKEQTEEIRRLKALNQSLKAKFEKLEQSSSHQHDIEERMLQRNEELEKHLLGMLKSQEIIFDMKENLKAASADNEKLTKDYKEAVKALEAVDKLFGQKDALVKKWKEATEESRQLVELLKKHNAEVGDLETVDKLKEEIASLKGKISKAEERNETTCVRNKELLQQSKTWKEKYERENEQAIKLNFELQEVTKELNNHQKLAGKRGRKNQMLQLEVTELKDTLTLAKEKLAENERRLKEMERKYADTQETYTKIIHEKEMQHSVLIKNSESFQKDLVANIENADNLRKEAESLKGNIVALEEEKIKMTERLKNNEKSLEDTLNIKAELSTQLAKLQSDFEDSKIKAVDNELYIEEQTVLLQELEEQCRQLQSVLKQYIHSGGGKRNRRPSTAPNRYGRKLRPSQTWPSHPQLDMYRQLLSPPRSSPNRRKPSPKRDARYRVQITDKNDSEDTLEDGTQKYEDFQRSYLHSNRPKSTYGNRSLSSNNQDRHHDRAHSSRDWVPKIVLVDSQKLESSSEADSDSVSADQYAMQYVKLGDKVLLELSVEGKKQNIPGVVKYVGPVYHSNFKSGIYAGLKLDIPVGDTNGTVGERVYFNCLKKHGKFVKLSHILAVQNPRTQQYTRILPMAYK